MHCILCNALGWGWGGVGLKKLPCIMYNVHLVCSVKCTLCHVQCEVCTLCNVHNGERNMSDLTAAAEVECARSAIILTNTLYPWSSSSSSSLKTMTKSSVLGEPIGIAMTIGTTVTLAAGIILLVQISLVKKMGSAEMTQLIPDIHGT